MPIPLHRLAGVAAAALCLASAGTAQAQGKGHGKEHKTAEARGDDRHRADGSVSDDRRRDDRQVNESRGDYDHGQYRGRNGVPPGLAKKPGGMPPGQYKKLYSTRQGATVLRDVLGRHGYPVVRSSDVGQSEYVYYRTPDGQLHRAVVTPGGDRLGFENVPSSLLTEVLSRLY
ncbi:MAG: hypothetical protein DMD35_02570 [Gemmatimonadetes bacterium]|nr:MAG: hypothetical protein DMD35_02570 [Gemmatimonadota bacterium]